MSRRNILIIVLFLAAALLRFADVFRPINQPSWRESDLGGISRNFVTEGMNPLYPRVDWRGDGPGYAEMELPLYPWVMAASYKIFGTHEQIARIWSFLFSLGALLFFYKLAREYLGLVASAAAFAFFAFNPLMVGIATSIQPEGLMIFTYIAAVYYFVRWIKTDRNTYFAVAAALTALTLLAKAPAGHIGLLFGVLLIGKYKVAIVREIRVWIFGIVTLVPAALWYLHSKSLWLTYGNSLGVSNEYHWVGWDFFTDLQFISGILRIEYTHVWTIFGLIVGAFAIWRGYREELLRLSTIWLASVFVLYIIAARTTSEDWAMYYHIFSVPAVSLMIGLGVQKLFSYSRELADAFSRRNLAANVSRVIFILFIIAAFLGSLLLETEQVRANFAENRIESPIDTFARQVKPLMKTDGLILVSGGPSKDPKGYPVAYNASYMFYWLARKGWNISVEEQSIAKVREYKEKGAVYFVAEGKYLAEKPGFENELRSAFPTVAESREFAVFDLTEGR